eukprot:2781766-Rhodomonas_salina.5
MDKDAIERCASGTDANKLLLDNALATAQLQPAKAWVSSVSGRDACKCCVQSYASRLRSSWSTM